MRRRPTRLHGEVLSTDFYQQGRKRNTNRAAKPKKIVPKTIPHGAPLCPYCGTLPNSAGRDFGRSDKNGRLSAAATAVAAKMARHARRKQKWQSGRDLDSGAIITIQYRQRTYGI